MLNNLDIAVLVDFGISKHYDSQGEQTSSSPLCISKGFAPWEQYLQGDVNHFTPSSDIYSLGATLCYLVTGTVPPEAPLLNDENLERPTGISNNLWSTIERSMQPRRKDRPQNVESFLSLLDNQSPSTEKMIQGGNISIIKQKDTSIGVDDSTIIERIHPITNDVKREKHEYVDLGLSVKWATCNVGATKPEEYGNYYAWGEIETKKEYSLYAYKYVKKGGIFTRNKYLKYNTDKGLGMVDNKMKLESVDDVACFLWGDKWRMPTDEEFRELIENCNWTWTTQNGINGYMVTGKRSGYENQSIFLPLAGCRLESNLYGADSFGCYWSSMLNSSNPYFAQYLYFNSSKLLLYNYSRFYGRSVRPVCP